MDSITLCRRINNAWPEHKDRQRAEDIINKAEPHYHQVKGQGKVWVNLDEARSLLANKQLKAIKDYDKFYRRSKAFLEKNITIKFDDTIFSECADLTAKEFNLQISKAKVYIADANAEVDRVMDF